MLYKRLSNWNDHSVYKNDRGEVFPEVLNAMLAIKSYEDGSQIQNIKGGKGGKWEWDL